MIVKNESHIIEKTLENILSYIPITQWVISDTGSSDNTKDIIKQYFTQKNIKGELYDDEWKNFAHNRTKALEYAYNKTDYLFIFDADDKIHGNLILPDTLEQGQYSFRFGDDYVYYRPLLINNKKNGALKVLFIIIYVQKKQLDQNMI